MRKNAGFENTRIPPNHRMWISHVSFIYANLGETDIIYIPQCSIDLNKKGKDNQSQYGERYVSVGIPSETFRRIGSAISQNGGKIGITWDGSQEVKSDQCRWRLLNLKHNTVQVTANNEIKDVTFSQMIGVMPGIYDCDMVFQVNITHVAPEGTQVTGFSQSENWNISFKYAAGLILNKSKRSGTQANFVVKQDLVMSGNQTDPELSQEISRVFG